jgi:hypothetical protein
MPPRRLVMATTVNEQIQVQLSFRRAHSRPISGVTGLFGIGRMLATDLCGEQYGYSRCGGIACPNRGSSLMCDFGVWPVASFNSAHWFGR